MCVLSFLYNFEKFLILSNTHTEQDMLKSVYLSSCNVPVILVTFELILQFSRQNFEKYLNIKIREIVSNGSRIAPCRQTDSETLRS